MPAFKSVDEYMAAQPPAARAVLARVRSAIKKALPRADEVIAYQIPAYKLGGRAVIYFAGWKEHFSIYPASRDLVAAFKRDLARYEVSDKGTIRFPLAAPPTALITRIAKFRAVESAGKAKLKAKAKPSTRRNPSSAT